MANVDIWLYPPWFMYLLIGILVFGLIFLIFKPVNRGPPKSPQHGRKRPFHVRAMHLTYHFLTSFGFIKLCGRRLAYYFKLYMNKERCARKGHKAPDAKVVTQLGVVKSLKVDYFEKYADMPIIINMGSYS